MKKIIFAFILLLPLFGKAQAHLGATLAQLRAYETDNVFTIDYSSKGQKFVKTDFVYGTFYYYFDNETGLTNFCFQLPKNMAALNAQVESYNKKYVILSENSWRAYLEKDGKMTINLIYDKEYDVYSFIYSQK